MRVFSYISLLVLFLCFLNTVQAQNTPVPESNGKSVKLVQYMIRKGDYVIAIAKRFHVPVKEIIKINHFKGKDKVIYPGRKLWIPVATKEKVWSPETATTFNSFLTKEDARPRGDFEVDMDSLDDEIKEDFVTTSDMEADSIQRNKIANHILKIEKKIQYLQYRLDSIKNADLGFQFDENDKNSILHKMKLARDRFYSSGPIGLEIDSLNVLKAHLSEENGRIKARLSEYEYLQENTNYFRKNREGMKNATSIRSEPGSQIANESSYLSSGLTLRKNKKEEGKRQLADTATNNIAEQNVSNNSVSKNAEVIVEVAKSEKEKVAVPEAVKPPVLNESDKENKKALDAPAKDRNSVVIESMPNSSTTNELKTNENKKLGVNNNFIRSQGNKSNTVPTPTNTVKVEVEKPEKSLSKDIATKPKEVKQNANTVQKVALPMDTGKFYHRTDSAILSKGHKFSSSLDIDTSRFDMSTRIDSTVLKPKPEKVSDDPLASYKTDSNFIMKTVVIKDITFTDYRNRPKYLTPVDSIHRIKSEFYLILARKALAKPDFKEGEKLLRKSLELNPNYAQAWMLHADLYAATGYPEKALREYSISSEIDTTNPKVFYNMALLFGKANNTDKAYQCYSKALDINDKYLLAYLGRAALLIEQRDYSGAIDDYDKVVAINKYYSLAYKGRGLAKMEARNFEGAVLDFNQYLEIEDPDGYILYQRGISKVLSNQLLQGCLDFSSSFELGFKQAEKAIKKFCQ